MKVPDSGCGVTSESQTRFKPKHCLRASGCGARGKPVAGVGATPVHPGMGPAITLGATVGGKGFWGKGTAGTASWAGWQGSVAPPATSPG